MLKIFFTTTILLFSFGPNAWASVKGFWFDPSTLVILEFTDKKAIFSTFNNYKENQYVIDYEVIDEARIHFQSNKVKISTIADIDKDGSLSIKKLKEIKGPMRFTRPVNIPNDEILGTWLTDTRGDNIESSLIVRQKSDSYDSEFIELNHTQKTYTKDFISNIESHFKYGFMFFEPVDKDVVNDPNVMVLDNYYFVTEYNNGNMTLKDVDGNTWIQKRIDNPKHLDIPKSYTLTTDE